MRRNYLGAAALLALNTILSGCQKDEKAAETPPPSAVGVVKLRSESLPIINELPGRVAPTRLAEVRPRVTGIVVDQVFQQGSFVNKGDVLYRIDPAQFQVQVSSAEATLKRAQASRIQAQQSADRVRQLRQSNVTSQRESDSAIALLAQADADVAVAQAGLDEARLNLQYTNVTAPISGRIGRALITEGALVSANGSVNLATIQQMDPIYADFTQPAADIIRLRTALKDGELLTGPNEAPVHMILDDGKRYPLEGRLLFSEAAVDESTGQVTLRGEFPNPKGDLLPGMYVRVQIEQGIQRAALAVPTQAVQRDAGGNANVLIVNDKNVVEQRRVVLGRIIGQRWVVESGLKEGESVVAEGFQKTAAGAMVAPVAWNAPETTAAIH